MQRSDTKQNVRLIKTAVHVCTMYSHKIVTWAKFVHESKRRCNVMNEKKLLNREMYFNFLDFKFKELMKYKQSFQNEIFKSEYNDYFTDMFEDNIKLMMFLNNNYSGDYYINQKVALIIMQHIESCDELMRDVRRYLCVKFGTTQFFERLENYKKRR